MLTLQGNALVQNNSALVFSNNVLDFVDILAFFVTDINFYNSYNKVWESLTVKQREIGHSFLKQTVLRNKYEPVFLSFRGLLTRLHSIEKLGQDNTKLSIFPSFQTSPHFPAGSLICLHICAYRVYYCVRRLCVIFAWTLHSTRLRLTVAIKSNKPTVYLSSTAHFHFYWKVAKFIGNNHIRT